MLQHVIEAQVFDQILRGVNLLVAELELGFNHERRGITVAAGGGVVRAGITTLRLHVWNIAILCGISTDARRLD